VLLCLCRRLDMFPQGASSVSLFLAVDEPDTLPAGWEFQASFKIMVVNCQRVFEGMCWLRPFPRCLHVANRHALHARRYRQAV